MATMLVHNKYYGRVVEEPQQCSRCGEAVEWKKQGKIWSPTNPGTGKFHVCKEITNGENTN